MILRGLTLASVMALAMCGTDESIAAFVPDGATYQLIELDDARWTHRATLTFDPSGAVRGQAPCNRYSAQQTVPYPWIEIGPIVATRMACPALEAEAAFFDALNAMTLSEVSGDVLILSNDDGRKMVFAALPAPQSTQ